MLTLALPARAGLPAAFRLTLAMAAILPAATVLAPTKVSAQAVVALVNNAPVTTFDVEQRMRIASMTERRRLDRKAAIQELIDDQVKLIEARRVGYRVTEEGVEQEFIKLAKGARMSEREFETALQRAGIQPSALRAKIRADLAWVVLLRDQARRGSQVTNDELETEIEARRRKEGVITEYVLRPVVFIVARGTSPGSRMAAANSVRARFNSCETGFDEIRSLPDVAIRPPIMRTSTDLSPQLRQLFERTPVDRMTPPSPSSEGIEIVAVCSKKERENPASQRSAVAVDLSERKITANAKTYIESLRKKVDIRFR
ncbi:MAG: SurA N-terminal domain-containing protein [Beijerinckiaceae bacterium]|nr:SurA N-terminal domain-containing protein [Beijerinckiaceae bacterium]MCZ8299878.1 SurA N-terminal domain-containing protein [Beijerinckiaceae bacterium]